MVLSITYEKIGKKWEFKDAVYKKKKIGPYLIELIGGKDRGAIINIWMKSNDDTYLGHAIVTPDKKHEKLVQLNFSYYSNAIDEYNLTKTSSDVNQLMAKSL